jgi:hypothetical protein
MRRRVVRFAVLGGLVLFLPLVLMASEFWRSRQVERCSRTPPGFPKRLGRAGVGISVEGRAAHTLRLHGWRTCDREAASAVAD